MDQSKTIPHLRNVNMDPSLCGTIRHIIDKNELTIGSVGNVNIGLSGLG
jgi:hypothetical protein